MCAKFGCGPTVVSKKGGVQIDRQTDRQTDRRRDTAALYNRYFLVSFWVIYSMETYFVYIKGQHDALKVKFIWESKIVLGAECSTGQGKFEITVRIRVSVRLELGLYIWLVSWLWLQLINTTHNLILNPDT